MKPLAAVDGTVGETHVMSDDLASQKQTLRARMRLNLRELHAPQVADWSVALMERLLTLAASWPPGKECCSVRRTQGGAGSTFRFAAESEF